MEKIKGFQISSMTVSGFKCYEAPMEITFGNPTIVTGGNGRGKSSLADAIAFAVTGLPFFGERGIDRLHNETNPDLQITMRFTDDTGKAHELTRSRQKDRMSITYDGYAIRQTDLNEMFGERDVFLSIFNPLYFIEELGEDGKKLLERYLPPIPQTDVLAQLNEQTQQRLSGLQLPSPETFLKNRREEIRELEQDAVYLSGKLDLAQKQRQSSKDLSDRLTAQIQELQSEIASLEARRFETVNLEDLQEQLVQASEQYEALSGEAPETPDTAELDLYFMENGRTGREAARVSCKAGRSVVRGLPAKIHRPAGRGYGKGAGVGEKVSAECRAFEAVPAGYKLPGLPPCAFPAGISGVPSGFTGGNGENRCRRHAAERSDHGASGDGAEKPKHVRAVQSRRC